MKHLFIKTILSLGALLFTTSNLYAIGWEKYHEGLNSREWKQYIEFIPGLNYGSTTINLNNFTVPNNPNLHDEFNIGIGYGARYGVSYFGFRANANFYNRSTTNSKITKNIAKVDFGGVLTGDFAIKSRGTYSLLLFTGFDLINYRGYRASLIGGLGIAAHSIKTKSTINVLVHHADGTNKTITSNKQQNNLLPTIAFSVGMQQEYFITPKVALGLELNYVHLGSPEYTLKDDTPAKHHNRIRLNSDGMLSTSLNIRVYY